MTKKFKDLTLKEFLHNYKYNKENDPNGYFKRALESMLALHDTFGCAKCDAVWLVTKLNFQKGEAPEIGELDFIIEEFVV